jgi:uncharacterized protein YbjT (DUF2867 family)
MRVLVTGAYGLIGSACLARLYNAGHDVVGSGRSIGAARRRFPYAQWIEADFLRLQNAEAWQPLLGGIDAVVNCVGVLQDGWRDDVQRIQQAGTVALFDACQRAGVRRVVHISALGAEAAGPSRFSRTKAAAEAYLQTLALDWVILRPALVLGSGVYGGTAMLRGIAAFPFVVPVVHAGARIQIISLDDLAETVVRLVAPQASVRVLWDVAHPKVHKLADIATAIRSWLGFPPRRVLRLPDAFAKIIGFAADAAGWLGWRSPMRATSFAQLADGVVGDPAPWMAATGIAPKSLDQLLAARPAHVQDRWFARLYLLKPLAILAIAAATFTTAALQFVSGWKLAAAMTAGVPAVVLVVYLLPVLFYGGVALVLGCGLIFRATARFALIALIVLALLQTAGDAWTAWQFKFFPYGVLTYELPIVLAMLLTLAILDDR